MSIKAPLPRSKANPTVIARDSSETGIPASIEIPHLVARAKGLAIPTFMNHQPIWGYPFFPEAKYTASGDIIVRLVITLCNLGLLNIRACNGTAFYVPAKVGKTGRVELDGVNATIAFRDNYWFFSFAYECEGKQEQLVEKQAQLKLAVNAFGTPMIVIDAAFDHKW